MLIKRGTADLTVYLNAVDQTGGLPKTGLTFGAVDVSYAHDRTLAQDIAPVWQSPDGDHSDGGFCQVDAGKQPGVYRLDLPDAVADVGPAVRAAIIHVLATDVLFTPLRLEFAADTLSGSRVWTIHVEAPAGTALPGARVTLRNDNDDTILDSRLTDAGGDAVFEVPDGDYNVHLEALGKATFTNPTPVTISGDTTTQITGTPFSPSGSAGPDECVVVIWIEGGQNEGEIKAKLAPPPQQQGAIVLLAEETATFVTDHYEIVLPRLSTWEFHLPPDTGGKTVTFAVPDEATADLTF